MVTTIISQIIVSQSIVGATLGSLIVLLVAAALIDYAQSPVKFVSRYLDVFIKPFLILFVYFVLIWGMKILG
jgi:hypothetical protein